MDLGYAFMLLGGVGGGSGDAPAKPEEHDAPGPDPKVPDAPKKPVGPPSPGLGDPRAPDANPIDPRVFR
jgi:hypothetical protein